MEQKIPVTKEVYEKFKEAGIVDMTLSEIAEEVIRLKTDSSPVAVVQCSDGLVAAFLKLRGCINLVANTLDRDAEERPVRGEMAEQLRNDFGKFAELLEKETGI